MSTELIVLPQAALSRQVDHATWNALSEIYGDPSPEKLGLVLDYCRARKMDPLKKPVHIVPVYSKKKNMMVETIWPAISEVRATAMRTGVYAGRDATLFGPMVKKQVGQITMEYPEWAQVTVYRIVAGARCMFVGPVCEWLECYSRMGKDPTPNSMWQKRAKGQLDKCAEASALRAAFPEETGGQATAEEMEGKDVFDAEEQTEGATDVTPPVRPKVERAKKGAAAALEAQPAQDARKSADQAQAVDNDRANPASAQTPRQAEIAKASASAVDAELDATPAKPLTALADKQVVTVTCEVTEMVCKDFSTTPGKPKLAVRAILKGEFNGSVYDMAVTSENGKLKHNDAWTIDGLKKLTLSGKARQDKTVAVMVESIADVTPAGSSDVP